LLLREGIQPAVVEAELLKDPMGFARLRDIIVDQSRHLGGKILDAGQQLVLLQQISPCVLLLDLLA